MTFNELVVENAIKKIEGILEEIEKAKGEIITLGDKIKKNEQDIESGNRNLATQRNALSYAYTMNQMELIESAEQGIEKTKWSIEHLILWIKEFQSSIIKANQKIEKLQQDLLTAEEQHRTAIEEKKQFDLLSPELRTKFAKEKEQKPVDEIRRYLILTYSEVEPLGAVCIYPNFSYTGLHESNSFSGKPQWQAYLLKEDATYAKDPEHLFEKLCEKFPDIKLGELDEIIVYFGQSHPPIKLFRYLELLVPPKCIIVAKRVECVKNCCNYKNKPYRKQFHKEFPGVRLDLQSWPAWYHVHMFIQNLWLGKNVRG
jgi:hypothetical protein